MPAAILNYFNSIALLSCLYFMDQQPAVVPRVSHRPIQMSGFLTKKSNKLLSGYNERYLSAHSDFGKSTSNNSDSIITSAMLDSPLTQDQQSLSKPCNFFNLSQVEVEEGNTAQEFILRTPESQIKLRASNADDRQNWMKAICYYRRKILQQKNEKSTSDNTGTTNSTSPDTRKPPRLRIMTSARIKTDMLTMDPDMVGRLQLTSYLRLANEQVVKHNIMCGYLKQAKGKFLKQIQQNFFLLFSCKSLYPDRHVSSHFLLDSQLPPWLPANHLIEIDQKTNNKNKIFGVGEIIEFRMKDDDTGSENLYTLGVVLPTSVVEFIFNIRALRDRWQQLFELAKKNASEAQRQDGKPIRRNIDVLVRQLSEGRLEKRLQNIYEEHRPKQYTLPTLIQYFKKIQQEIDEIKEAALAREPKQLDLLQTYVQFLHEKVFLEAKLFWDSSFQKISTLQLLQLLKCTDMYCHIMREEIQDTRFNQGLKTLLHIFGRRVWQSLQPMIVSVARNDKKDNYFTEEDILHSNSIVDLFKLLNDSFTIYYAEYPTRQSARMLTLIVKLCLNLYNQSLIEVVEEGQQSQKQLVAIGNNVVLYNKFLRQFVEEKLISIGLDINDAQELSDMYNLSKGFNQISTIVKDRLMLKPATEIASFYTNKRYLTTSIESSIDLINQKTTFLQEMHSINQRTFWKGILQCLVENIAKAICNVPSDKRKDHVTLVADKLNTQITFIKTEFGVLLLKSTVADGLKPLESLMLALVSTDPETIIRALSSDQLDVILNTNLIKKLMECRSDLNKKQIQEIIQSVDQGHNESRGRAKSRRKRKTIALVSEVHEDEEQSNEDEEQEEEQPQAISEGYMLKKKSERKIWQRRYFRIIRGNLYWYQNQHSQKCHNFIELNKVSNIFTTDQNKLTFHLVCNGQKEYKFKCTSLQEKQRWMLSIKKELAVKTEPQSPYKPKKIEEKATLFVDYEVLTGLDDVFPELPEEIKSPTRIGKKESIKAADTTSVSPRLQQWRQDNKLSVQTKISN